VFSLPAKAATLSQGLFHHRRCVDEDLDLAAEAGRDELRQVFQFPLDNVMVVSISGVNRNGTLAASGKDFKRVILRGIGKSHNDHASSGRP
jgi:hypothetical protein